QPILGGDDPSYFPDVTIQFDYDDACMTSSCMLTITLTYNGSNQADLGGIAQTLSGVAFDAFSGATQIDLSVALSTSTVSAESLVGAGSDDAISDFGGGPNSNLDVTRHWGFRSGFASTGTLGSSLLSSVGDAFPDLGALGMADLFTSGTLSGVEPNPPDGTSFSIVDDATCTGPPGSPSCGGKGGGFQDSGNRAWIQNSAVATLKYDGTTNKLTSIANVDPIFGTEGRPIPEPGAGLTLMGLLALGLWGWRRS
ncbi:MAG: hypothetical protein ABFS46_17135, partial [Myxococcota bacterium]